MIFKTTLKLWSSCFWAPSLSLETCSLLCIRAPLIKSQSKGQTLLGNGDIGCLQLYSYTQRSDSLSWWASYYILWNESLQLASRLYTSTASLIRSLNSLLSGFARGLLVFIKLPRDRRKTYLNVFFPHVSFIFKNPPPFTSISCSLLIFLPLFTVQLRRSWPLALPYIHSNTHRRPHWENKETACQQTAVYFTTEHRAKALGNKKQKQKTSLFSSSASILLAF